ncbi:disrupted in schizophrenia 1 protein isoform X3 [Scyliorhinus canicula]|uniref:disrupted in schizophrenia 1 protein isoform X3 n=1 Tax=Scyliorhinus canicula TaxID=7830 RepID=UPI0018F58ED8|nr:disrupted in schizophrenia 1 protein isoform X3 [Scyliorhinus canicula]
MSNHCISILTGLSSSKKKLSKRPGYMKKDVEQRLHRPTHVGVHFVSQHVENERENCTDLSFNNNRLEGYFLNNLKHLSEDKIAEHQNTILNHLGAASPIVAAFQPNMIMSESIRYSDSNCQWTDGCGGSCYTGINTCSKPLPTGCLQKQDAGPTQCEMEKGIDVSKPQAVPSPNKQVDSENLPRLQPCDIDEEVNSANGFVSSFIFIQMSLNCHSINVDSKELQQNEFVSTLQFSQAEPHLSQYPVDTLATNQFCPKPLRGSVEIPCLHVCQNVDIKCGTNTDSKDGPQDYDRLSLDADFSFLCSADSSDYSSSSSVTSGYESSISAFDQKCNSLLRKYEPILQDCLLENRMTLKLQSMIQKLKKLQKKAVQEDDYEKADKFSKKLAELKREKSSLKFQLPSYQPCIARFLQEVKLQSQVAEHHNNAGSLLKSTEDKYSDSNPDNQHLSWSRRKQLILDRQQLQEEISDLKERLAILEAQDNQLSIEIEEESRLIHSYDCELNSLSTLSTNELQDLNKILEDVLPLRNKILFTVKLPEDIKRLQKKEQSLSTAIKTATTKVCNSQKLCSNLSKKVSGIEAQLPTLLEAKMLSISGREFSTAKDLAEEIKYLTSEKTRFEEFISELQHLSIKNAQRVEALREEYSSLRTELVQEEGLFENNLKENVFKYMEVLEDKLHSYGSQLLEKVWEADLEACQIYVRGLQLKEGNYHATEREEFQADEYNKAIEDACTEVMVIKDSVFPSKQDWCAKRCSSLHQKETDPSEVSFKCSFSIKDIQSEVAYNRGSAVDIEEECEMIRDRLLCLEGQLQMAIYNHDNSFSQYLQREIQMVKETLQAMLKQLLPLEKEEKEELGNFVINSW